MSQFIAAIIGIAFLAGTALADGESPLSDPEDRISYSLGYQIGGDLRQQDLDINPEAVRQGIEDAQAGSGPQLNSDEMNSILMTVKKDIVKTQQEIQVLEREKIKEGYRGEGREFLAKNAETGGVVTLPSGLQYTIDREGAGRTPGPHDTVRVHYRGTLLDGTEFDSSYRHGQAAEFRVDGVIAGWTEALQLMKEGAKWRIFVPADLAYGERGPLADRTVIFDMELIAVVSEK